MCRRFNTVKSKAARRRKYSNWGVMLLMLCRLFTVDVLDVCTVSLIVGFSVR